MKAWHFCKIEDGKWLLRDGREVPPDGVPLVHVGGISMCHSGLHFSTRLIDALEYAPGAGLCRVDCSGDVRVDRDKGVCSSRTVLWRIDAESLLRDFARRCALDVVHLWDAPPVVLDYLKTGRDDLRDAARTAERTAEITAAGEAAWDAAWDAVRDAVRGAAWDAAWNRRLTAMISAARRKNL